MGHFARKCPEGEGNEGERMRGGRRDIDLGGGGGSKCYKYNRFGHFARKCPKEEYTTSIAIAVFCYSHF